MEDIDSLIEQLARLHLQQAILRREEEDILRKLLLARGKDFTERQADRTTSTTEVDNIPQPRIHQVRRDGYRVGDRVRITNRIDTSFGRPHNEKDRTGIVTKITAKRVFLRTDNNNITSRSPNNLILYREHE